DPDDYSRQLLMDLNRTYPQILCDKEAHKFRNLRVLTKLRLAELLRNLHCKGEEACHEFYRGLQIHAEDLFCRLPSRVRYQGKKVKVTLSPVYPKYTIYNVYPGPMFFLSCFSLVVGVAILYYYGGTKTIFTPQSSLLIFQKNCLIYHANSQAHL
uniref:Caspase recruitment domain family member 19 n=1 Tax=Neogobius melanostomus TaxID=47308 RepID=A0A8C6TJL9_9GOBI